MKKFIKSHKKLFISAVSVFTVLVLLFSAFAVYVGNYYRATETAAIYTLGGEAYKTETTEDHIVFRPDHEIKAGLIFYPGGKVEHTAYAPLMAELAQKGVLCILVKMPCRLAVFGINSAKDIRKEFSSETDNWYIGGHSLGGAMAASHVSKNLSDYKGLLLLGAYSTADISKSGLDVISVYGSEDNVLNRKKYNSNMPNLPQDTDEVVIIGGNHSGFADYGDQKGDGVSFLRPYEQIRLTAEAFEKHIK